MTEDEKKTLRGALDHYGEQAQTLLLMEEMGELASAISKYHRGRVCRRSVAEEIADVQIMCAQTAILYGSDLVEEARREKINRLKERMK